MVDARKPAAAGVFDPSERDTLARVVRELLDAASQPELPESHSRAVRAIVVPHGLYATAGSVMAAGWSSVAAAAPRIRRIVLLGPAHHMPFLGLAAPYADAFATPLGVVPVDRIAIETTRRFPPTGRERRSLRRGALPRGAATVPADDPSLGHDRPPPRGRRH